MLSTISLNVIIYSFLFISHSDTDVVFHLWSIVFWLFIVFFCLLCHLELMATKKCSHSEIICQKFDDVIQTFPLIITLAIIFLFIVLNCTHINSNVISYFCLYSLLLNQHQMNPFFISLFYFSSQSSNDYNLMHKLSPVQSHTHIRKEEE